MASTSSLNILENVRFLHAYLECSDRIQAGIQAMLRIAFDPASDEQEKAMALHTVADSLFPNYYKEQLGMDLEESENDGAASDPELSQIVDEMNEEEATFAKRLSEIMESRGVTQEQLAKSIGVGQPAISNMLNRQCRPQRRTILKVAEALNVQPQDLWPKLER